MSDPPPIIFLDIDGVLCTQPLWKPEVMAADGYSVFNAACVQHLNALIAQTGAHCILTSSRRMTQSVAAFQAILERRGFRGQLLGKIDEATAPTGRSRPSDILDWLHQHGTPLRFVIIDDDARLAELPLPYRAHWVRTQFHRGFDAAALAAALLILQPAAQS